MAEKLRADGIRFVYRNERTGAGLLALDDISVTVDDGEFVAIVGPSGCGKTTFLNIVDGLLPPTAGAVYLDGSAITGPGPDRAMVFQSGSLLPWRTVLGNVTWPLELRRTPRAAARAAAKDVLALVGLTEFSAAYPFELSGGMQQRVNLARALALKPELLLLDEPFAALDAQTRELMQEELLRIWQQSRTTAIFVTHQISEAVYLADKVLVFGARPGRLREVVNVGLPRPRTFALKRTQAFLELEGRIWKLIESEARRGFLAQGSVPPK